MGPLLRPHGPRHSHDVGGRGSASHASSSAIGFAGRQEDPPSSPVSRLPFTPRLLDSALRHYITWQIGMLSETLKQQETPLATRQLPAAQQPPPQHSDPMAQQWLPQETADTTRPSRQSSQAGAERSGPAQVKAPLTLRQVLHDPHLRRHSPQWLSVS